MISQNLIQLHEQLKSIRVKKNIIQAVPQPKIIKFFEAIHRRNKIKNKIYEGREKIKLLTKNIQQNSQQLQIEQKFHEERNEILKDKLIILKAYISNYQLQYEQAKKSMSELEFIKILISAIRKGYVYRLAEIFCNDQARNLYKGAQILNFKFDTNLKFPYNHILQSDLEEQICVALSYSSLIIHFLAKILNINLLNKFIFKGNRSYIENVDKQIFPVYLKQETDRKSFEQGLRLVHKNICQIFEAININKKYTKDYNLKIVLDLICQYIIVNDIQMIQFPN